jgi:cytochrome c-type biogenesis protein CcmH/NrfG
VNTGSLRSLRVPRYVAIILLALCVVAGYLTARWLWPRARDTTPLAQICARVDYIASLQEQLPERQASGEAIREEFKALVEQCRTALRDRAEETD